MSIPKASLVHHYLAFMVGSDTQQVTYSVTILREYAHSGTVDIKEGIVILPEIGHSYAMDCSSDLDPISD